MSKCSDVEYIMTQSGARLSLCNRDQLFRVITPNVLSRRENPGTMFSRRRLMRLPRNWLQPAALRSRTKVWPAGAWIERVSVCMQSGNRSHAGRTATPRSMRLGTPLRTETDAVVTINIWQTAERKTDNETVRPPELDMDWIHAWIGLDWIG